VHGRKDAGGPHLLMGLGRPQRSPLVLRTCLNWSSSEKKGKRQGAVKKFASVLMEGVSNRACITRSFDRWLVLIYSEREISSANCWCLIRRERGGGGIKLAGWAAKRDEQCGLARQNASANESSAAPVDTENLAVMTPTT
jgi:hypothetical protein